MPTWTEFLCATYLEWTKSAIRKDSSVIKVIRQNIKSENVKRRLQDYPAGRPDPVISGGLLRATFPRSVWLLVYAQEKVASLPGVVARNTRCGLGGKDSQSRGK